MKLNNNYNIETNDYYSHNMKYINFTIKFDDRFKYFDISKTIKEILQ